MQMMARQTPTSRACIDKQGTSFLVQVLSFSVTERFKHNSMFCVYSSADQSPKIGLNPALVVQRWAILLVIDTRRIGSKSFV